MDEFWDPEIETGTTRTLVIAIWTFKDAEIIADHTARLVWGFGVRKMTSCRMHGLAEIGPTFVAEWFNDFIAERMWRK